MKVKTSKFYVRSAIAGQKMQKIAHGFAENANIDSYNTGNAGFVNKEGYVLAKSDIPIFAGELNHIVLQRLIILLFLIIHHVVSGFAQDYMGAPFADSTVIADSSYVSGISDSSSVVKYSSGYLSEKENSVFDIYWVTNSLKSGWKATDTTLAGMGLETCDTAHTFIMPVTGKFWRGCTYYHSGWDIGSDYGSPVVAGLGGKVRYTDYCSGYGKLVIIRHHSGMEVYYAHLSKILVTTDQFVEAGDTIGLVGATGRARGNHLHMEFRLYDRALDIADYYVQDDTTVNLYKIFDTSSKQNQPQAAEYHTVVRGNTLTGIANRYGTTVTNLCKLNNISSKSVLRIGQKIRVM